MTTLIFRITTLTIPYRTTQVTMCYTLASSISLFFLCPRHDDILNLYKCLYNYIADNLEYYIGIGRVRQPARCREMMSVRVSEPECCAEGRCRQGLGGRHSYRGMQGSIMEVWTLSRRDLQECLLWRNRRHFTVPHPSLSMRPSMRCYAP